MRSLTVKAPAKLNLYLRVCKKRPDGYHNIETIFEKIDLCDEITIKRRAKGIKVSSSHPDVPNGAGNLCFRAASVLLKERCATSGVEITIKKRIPVAAGMGGGSSDAAATLYGVNKLLRLRATQATLLRIAQSIGADVPFFLIKATRAIGRGKGEILFPLNSTKKFWYIISVPPIKVSTKAMYQHPRITLTKPICSVKIMIRVLLKNSDLTAFGKYSYNSFEKILQKKYRQILEIKKALTSLGAPAALMSGSGPSVFGITLSRKEAMDISARLRFKDKNCQIIVAQTSALSKRRKK